MKKALLSVIVVTGMAATLGATLLTNPASGTVNVGQAIGVRTDCVELYPNTFFMNWGDGTITSGSNSNVFYNSFQFHVYRNPGTFRMHFRRWEGLYNYCPTDEYRNVFIVENRYLTVSPSLPGVGQPITFTAVNFNTPGNVTWDMGDGTTYAHRQNVVTHTYQKPGSYTIRAYDWDGDPATTPVSLPLAFRRAIVFSPPMPRVDEPVEIRALGFNSDAIDWSFGDGTPPLTGASAVVHRYQNPGTFTITARESGTNAAPESQPITILPENRSLALSPAEARAGEPLTVTAVNFRGPLVLWDFGDGTTTLGTATTARRGLASGVSGPLVVTHAYKLPGSYTVTARDENGASEKRFQAQVRILGISDQVSLEVAEIALDNGKYYKVVPRNSKSIRALLRMKLRGTGIVSGQWIVDGQPFAFFSETAYQGQVKTIPTPEVPGLPTFAPGMHTLTVQLARPAGEGVVFRVLRYFVLPYENEIVVLAPQDGAVIREDEAAEFAWESALGGSYYQVAFADSVFPLMRSEEGLKWLDCPERLRFTPDAGTWAAIRRNHWTYWKVRAMDSGRGVVAESGVREIKIIVPGAEVGIERITDLDGKPIVVVGGLVSAKADYLIVTGSLTYAAEAEYLILRVFAGGSLADQLLFRDVRKGEARPFETSVPNAAGGSLVTFEVLKSSSPSVLVGYMELKLNRE